MKQNTILRPLLFVVLAALVDACVPMPNVEMTLDDLSVTLQEPLQAGDTVGTVTYTANSGTPSFSLENAVPTNGFAIDEASGVVTIANPAGFDATAESTYSATVVGFNQGTEARAQLTLTLEAVSGPLVVEDFAVTIAENPATNEVLGTVQTSGGTGTPSFALSNQNPAGAMTINASTGQIQVADAALYTVDTNPTLTATVSVSSGDETATGTVTITLEEASTGPTIWSGPTINFSKADGADPTAEANQDRLTDAVWITRGNGGGQIYNAVSESSATSSTSPAGTEWAEGDVADWESLTFEPFRSAVGSPKAVVGKNLVLHLIEDDIYLNVTFTSWSSGKQGGFAYDRATPE